MLHPHTELRWIGEPIGFGVFATQRIPRGTILWALDPLDQRISPDRARTMTPWLGELIEKYTFRNARGEHILCWDHGRFMNHSCAPVSLSPGVDFELAVRDLEIGDELTCDYGSLNLEQAFDCRCEQPGCRGRIEPDDFERMVPIWDAKLRLAARAARDVPQPLLGLLAEPNQLYEYAENPARLPSSSRHRLATTLPSLAARA